MKFDSYPAAKFYQGTRKSERKKKKTTQEI